MRVVSFGKKTNFHGFEHFEHIFLAFSFTLPVEPGTRF